jgi:hypothetical protein
MDASRLANATAGHHAAGGNHDRGSPGASGNAR